jgi:hypothetical protein
MDKDTSLQDFQTASKREKLDLMFDSFMKLIADGIKKGESDNIIRNYARLASEIYFSEEWND